MSRTTDDAQFVPLRVAVITISDSRTTGDDTSGDVVEWEPHIEYRMASCSPRSKALEPFGAKVCAFRVAAQQGFGHHHQVA